MHIRESELLRGPPGSSESRTHAAPGAQATAADPAAGYRRIAWLMVLSDVVCLIVALRLSYLIRFGWGPMPTSYLWVMALAPLAWVGTFRAYSLYSTQHLSAVEEFRRTISAASIGIVVIVMASYWSKGSFSRAWIGLTWALVLLLELVARRGWRNVIARLRASGHLAYRTLIVGLNDEARELHSVLQDRGLGFAPVGFVSSNGLGPAARSLGAMESLDELPQAIRRTNAHCLFVSSTSVSSQQILQVAHVARQIGTEVRVSANLPEIITTRLTLQPVGPVMSLALRPVRLSGTQAFLKRLFDLVVGGLLLLASFPFMAIIAVAIKLNSAGPVFFRQQRVTKGGRPFQMYKFRTMSSDADRFVEENDIDTTVAFFKLHDDPRLTRVGRILRKLSMDELPQLFNVLLGNMSLVGPRPLPADQVAANLDLLSPRHEVPAGISGWWQINGRSDVGPEEALRLDLFYIENWSLTLDLYILLKTVGVLIRRKGAY